MSITVYLSNCEKLSLVRDVTILATLWHNSVNVNKEKCVNVRVQTTGRSLYYCLIVGVKRDKTWALLEECYSSCVEKLWMCDSKHQLNWHCSFTVNTHQILTANWLAGYKYFVGTQCSSQSVHWSDKQHWYSQAYCSYTSFNQVLLKHHGFHKWIISSQLFAELEDN